jgi:hypothetical protein
MNYSRLALAAIAGTLASFIFGFLVIWLVPALMNEARNYPTLFRAREEMGTYMPYGFAASFVAVLVVTIIFAMIHQGGSGPMEGARLGVLIGIFAICNVMHNYANYNFGLKLALGQSAAYFFQWIVVGLVIGLIYKPLATP